MLDISTGKIVRVIFLCREYGPDSKHMSDYISGLNEDEQVSLVALMWIGRETYSADEVEEALETARIEATAPTEKYLSGIPGLAEYLESGLDALGIDVSDAEDHM
ncbi:DUF3775 domain-containing protein [Boseongicola aestuarii]|jgi:hypothetical protein|uniref:DUF3775 domain-containing protein n=1 Tax=Boseongicola aestuarii TaxID=1470561 RepID=A0A238IXK0_9RHOB|nr:DUF3775 domain-containing protein [Boseongicola aestuarii]SMX23209.1 hypothetical protein BOA8489_01313 [Boseongicola aestuarii]